MMADAGYVTEETAKGRDLVVTGPWSATAERALRREDADGLVLNYARGFCEDSLGFLDGSWGLRRLKILDRKIVDLSPIGPLRDSLEDLSVQAAPDAELDLGALPRLRSIAGEWALIAPTLSTAQELQDVVTWQFGECDLHAFRDLLWLRQLTLKEAPRLKSLSGVEALDELAALRVLLAPRLGDIGDVAQLARSLRELELQHADLIEDIDDVEPLVNLHLLGVNDCGDVSSLSPIESLQQLELFHAWESTRIVDGDLSPLTRLPRLKEIRMRDRRGYKPRVAEIVAALST